MIKGLQELKPELRKKQIYIKSENGLLLKPELKFILNDNSNLGKTKENVDYILII